MGYKLKNGNNIWAIVNIKKTEYIDAFNIFCNLLTNDRFMNVKR